VDSDNLPEPEVLAAEVVENLETAREQFRSIYEEIRERNRQKAEAMKPLS
jgi:type I restriction enzyme M protein